MKNIFRKIGGLALGLMLLAGAIASTAGARDSRVYYNNGYRNGYSNGQTYSYRAHHNHHHHFHWRWHPHVWGHHNHHR
jgi:hypothetical protein